MVQDDGLVGLDSLRVGQAGRRTRQAAARSTDLTQPLASVDPGQAPTHTEEATSSRRHL